MPSVRVLGGNCRVPSWLLSKMDVGILLETLALPCLLEVPSPGVTFVERLRHVEALKVELAERGLEPVGALGDALVLLTCGDFVVDGRLTGGRPLDLVGAVSGDRAALAVRADDTIQISLMRDSALPGKIVDLLPTVGHLAGAGSAVARFGITARTRADRDRRVWTWYASQAGGVLAGPDSWDSPVWTTLVPADSARVGQYLGNELYDLRYGGVRVVRG
ncbi:ESX secretion-associated protein EspG [Actinophytocola sp.]|uniref:ESX secretion-associated protein EspG n=1 Tax=Actinophytocola sp. TaxID=1872138 RepID=UPI002ED65CB4